MEDQSDDIVACLMQSDLDKDQAEKVRKAILLIQVDRIELARKEMSPFLSQSVIDIIIEIVTQDHDVFRRH